MRIAFVFPNYFPYVRRGAERMMVEYAAYLTGVGHTVDVITSKPGPRRVVREGNLTIYYESQLTHPVLARYRPRFRFYSFSLTVMQHLLRRRYDVAHLWLFTYGLPMGMLRRVRGTPYLYHQMMEYTHMPAALDRWLFRKVLGGADRVATLTPAFARRLESEIGAPVEVLPPCVDMETFRPQGQRDPAHPRVFFASDANDHHKGPYLLLRAWNEIHRRCPNAELVFGGPIGQADFPTDADTVRSLAALVPDRSARAAIRFLGVGRPADLPRRYAEASVTVLPSLFEGFGLVLLESLACGTPVVGSAYGGPGDLITSPTIGATVSLRDWPDLEDPTRVHELAEAVLVCIDLAARPETSVHCREHARRWSREAVGRAVERVYAEMARAG